jgi:ketosteroid isomerase-like protein
MEPRRHEVHESQNKKIVEMFMDGFRRTDRSLILSTLTDDVEWDLPGAFHARGKDEFNRHIVGEGFVSSPSINVTRLTEEADVVVAEGTVRTERKDGTLLNLVFCDVFEMQGGKIRRLTSYLMATGD